MSASARSMSVTSTDGSWAMTARVAQSMTVRVFVPTFEPERTTSLTQAASFAVYFFTAGMISEPIVSICFITLA